MSTDDGVSITIVPASPGWNVLVPTTDRDGRAVAFEREPVIAWRVELCPSPREEFFTLTYPVCAQSCREEDRLLERPNGTIFDPGAAWFDSEDAALEYVNEEGIR